MTVNKLIADDAIILAESSNGLCQHKRLWGSMAHHLAFVLPRVMVGHIVAEYNILIKCTILVGNPCWRCQQQVVWSEFQKSYFLFLWVFMYALVEDSDVYSDVKCQSACFYNDKCDH